MTVPIDLTPVKPFVTRRDGLAFDPDAYRPGWLRCRVCVQLVLGASVAIERHECPRWTAGRAESEAPPC